MNASATRVVTEILKSRICRERNAVIKIDPKAVFSVIEDASAIMDEEPAVLELDGEYCVVGDLHGNIDSLIRIFEKYQYPPDRSYLFLGDYVDRGCNSCEVILLLYAMKVLFPERVFLVRGNHEFAQMTSLYGFKKECKGRLSKSVYKSIVGSFDKMAVAALIGGNFCVHGGISPSLMSIDDVMRIDKANQRQMSNTDMVNDLLWSDPSNDIVDFEASPRGCGYLFGEDAAVDFLRRCGLNRIVRAHETCQDGYDWPFMENGPVLTVFSSCDYCEMMNDAAAIVLSSESDNVSFAKFSPLNKKQMRMRRITFPEWLLTQSVPMKEVDTSMLLNEITADAISAMIGL